MQVKKCNIFLIRKVLKLFTVFNIYVVANVFQPSPLFQKIEASTIADLKKRFAGQGPVTTGKAKVSSLFKNPQLFSSSFVFGFFL